MSETPEDFDSLAGRVPSKLPTGRVMKHRIDQERLEKLVKEWTRLLNQEEMEEVHQE